MKGSCVRQVRMAQKIFSSFSFILVALLAACTLPQLPFDSSTAVPTSIDNIANPEPTKTTFSLIALTPEATAATLSSPVTPITGTSQAACNRAAAGRPLDITFPDGAVLKPGEPFIKTWRLTNIGTCEWNQNYAAVYFSGHDLSLSGKAYLTQVVAVNQSVDISVEMYAPLTPGVYQTNWILVSPEGELFGLGPAGDAPFWARIEVVAVETPTIEPTSTVTPTPPPYASGDVELVAGGSVDLDSGSIGSGPAADLVFNIPAEVQYEILPQNGARLAVYSFSSPTAADCLSITLNDSPVKFDTSSDGVYLCYLTNQGLPGSIRLSTDNLPKIKFQFQTWAIP